jgi:hypothetical protein
MSFKTCAAAGRRRVVAAEDPGTARDHLAGQTADEGRLSALVGDAVATPRPAAGSRRHRRLRRRDVEDKLSGRTDDRLTGRPDENRRSSVPSSNARTLGARRVDTRREWRAFGSTTRNTCRARAALRPAHGVPGPDRVPGPGTAAARSRDLQTRAARYGGGAGPAIAPAMVGQDRIGTTRPTRSTSSRSPRR